MATPAIPLVTAAGGDALSVLSAGRAGKFYSLARIFFEAAGALEIIKNPVGIMKLNDFKQVIKKMKQEVDMVTHVSLYSWGEPLLHTELNLLIDHLHEEGIAAAVSSHLSIPSSNQIQKLVKSAPEYLKISLSGFYPDAYNSTHTGGDINLVKSNMYKIKYYIYICIIIHKR